MLPHVMTTQQPSTTVPEVITSRPCDTKFGTLALKCVSCTETDKKDGFILKLVHESAITTATAFGKKITPVKHTFYMKVAEECAVGFEATQDLNIFTITEREFVFPDAETAEEVTVWCKWLHVPIPSAA